MNGNVCSQIFWAQIDYFFCVDSTTDSPGRDDMVTNSVSKFWWYMILSTKLLNRVDCIVVAIRVSV